MANNVTVSMTATGSEEDLWRLTQTLFEVTPYGVAFKGPLGRAGMVDIRPSKDNGSQLTALELSFVTRWSPPPEEFFEQIAASFPNITVEDGTIREEFCHFAYDFIIKEGRWQLEDRCAEFAHVWDEVMTAEVPAGEVREFKNEEGEVLFIVTGGAEGTGWIASK